MNAVLPENIKVDLGASSLGDCLKVINNIGGSIYRNICTGIDTYVPWGTSDWLSGSFLTAFVIVMGIITFWMLRVFLKEFNQ